jgi:hypothetical protein
MKQEEEERQIRANEGECGINMRNRKKRIIMKSKRRLLCEPFGLSGKFQAPSSFFLVNFK